jgi:hypothetical protein
MKYAFAVSLIVLLGGCASDPEDRAFFNRGWILPEKGSDQRINKPLGEPLKLPDSSPADDGADRPAL